MVHRLKIIQEKGMKQVKAYFRDGTILTMRQDREEGEVRMQGQDGLITSESQPYDTLSSFRRGWRTSGNPYIRHTLLLWE